MSNIVPADAGGRHKLGTIVDSLTELNVLNEDEEIVIPHVRRQCLHETNVEVSQEQIQQGAGGVALNFIAAGVPIGADLGGGGNSSQNDKFGFARVDTEWFQPTTDDYQDAVTKASGLKDYLESSRFAPVYMITGIKTGREPSITRMRGSKVEGKFLLGVDVGGVASIGPRGDGSRTVNLSQKSDVSTDLLFGIKVRKLMYKRRHVVLGKREWSNEPYNKGAELVGADRGEVPQADVAPFYVEEVELSNELMGCINRDEEDVDGSVITWILPEGDEVPH